MAGLLAGIGGAIGGGASGIGSIIGIGTSLIGAAVQAQGAKAEAAAKARAIERENAQLEIQRNNEMARAYVASQEEKRKKDFLLSQFRNRAAASGFSTDSVDLLGAEDDIYEYGTQRQRVAIFEGQNRAAGIRDRIEGNLAERSDTLAAGDRNASAAIFGGVAGMAKYMSGLGTGGSTLHYGATSSDPWAGGYR